VLPVVQERRPLVECTECGKCCTYVGVGINAPSRPRWATDILWHLYHEGTHIYLDGNGEWSMHFESRCRNLGADNRCTVYAERPHICRAHDNRTCEVNDHSCESITFRDPGHFLRWLAEHKPRVYAKIEQTHVPAHLRVALPAAGAAGTKKAPRRRAVAGR
jgi:Fe-S-cluster containining protein